MRTQFQNLSRVALAAACLLLPALAHAQTDRTSDPIDGARALLGRTTTAAPATVGYNASVVDPGYPSGEQALVAKSERPTDRQSAPLAAAVQVGSISERALLGR